MTAVMSLASRGNHVVAVVATAVASVTITVILMLTFTGPSTGAPAHHRPAANLSSCAAYHNATPGSPAASRLADAAASTGGC